VSTSRRARGGSERLFDFRTSARGSERQRCTDVTRTRSTRLADGLLRSTAARLHDPGARRRTSNATFRRWVRTTSRPRRPLKLSPPVVVHTLRERPQFTRRFRAPSKSEPRLARHLAGSRLASTRVGWGGTRVNESTRQVPEQCHAPSGRQTDASRGGARGERREMRGMRTG